MLKKIFGFKKKQKKKNINIRMKNVIPNVTSANS